MPVHGEPQETPWRQEKWLRMKIAVIAPENSPEQVYHYTLQGHGGQRI